MNLIYYGINCNWLKQQYNMVIPTNSNTCSDWRRTCHVSWIKTQQLPREFRLACDQVMLLGTAANSWASQHQANDFFLVFFIFLSWEVKQNTFWLVPQETVSFVSLRPRNCLKCGGLKDICWYRNCWWGDLHRQSLKRVHTPLRISYMPLHALQAVEQYWKNVLRTFNP